MSRKGIENGLTWALSAKSVLFHLPNFKFVKTCPMENLSTKHVKKKDTGDFAEACHVCLHLFAGSLHPTVIKIRQTHLSSRSFAAKRRIGIAEPIAKKAMVDWVDPQCDSPRKNDKEPISIRSGKRSKLPK